MLFVGAGASTSLGIPDMQGMVNTVYRNVEKEDPDYAQIIREIGVRFQHAGITLDIENLLGALEASLEPEKVWNEVGPKIAAVLTESSQKPLPYEDKVPSLVSKIKQVISNLCQSIDYAKAVTQYGQLFDALKESNGGTINNLPSLYRTVVTTNYDVAIEYYFRQAGIAYSEGFKSDDFGRFVFAEAWGNDTRRAVDLIKIHGSISYAEENVVIERVEVPVGGSSLYGPVARRIMIYPAGEKSITRRPYFDLYNRFRSNLLSDLYDSTLVVVGSSLRDIAIRNIIEDWLAIKKDARLFIFGRSAEAVQNSFPAKERAKIFARNLSIPSQGWDYMIRDEIRGKR